MSQRFQRKWSVGRKNLSFRAELGTRGILVLLFWNSVSIGFEWKLSRVSLCLNWQLKHVKQFKHAAGFFTGLVYGFSRNNVELRPSWPWNSCGATLRWRTWQSVQGGTCSSCNQRSIVYTILLSAYSQLTNAMSLKRTRWENRVNPQKISSDALPDWHGVWLLKNQCCIASWIDI